MKNKKKKHRPKVVLSGQQTPSRLTREETIMCAGVIHSSMDTLVAVHLDEAQHWLSRGEPVHAIFVLNDFHSEGRSVNKFHPAKGRYETFRNDILETAALLGSPRCTLGFVVKDAAHFLGTTDEALVCCAWAHDMAMTCAIPILRDLKGAFQGFGEERLIIWDAKLLLHAFGEDPAGYEDSENGLEMLFPPPIRLIGQLWGNN